MATRDVLHAQLKLAAALRDERHEQLLGVLKTAQEKVAGRLLGRVANFARGALGTGASKAVTNAQQAVGRARQGLQIHGQRMAGQRIVAGSPLHQALQRAGVQFRPTGTTTVMQGGVPVKPTIKNLEALRQGPRNTGGQMDANLMAMLHRARVTPKARAVGGRFQGPQVSQAQLPLQLRVQQFRALQQARGAAPLQQAYQAGQAMQPALATGAKVLGGAAGIGAAGAGLGLGVPALLAPNVKAAALHKIAARIINADVGLEDIIAHIKAAKVKKAAPAGSSGTASAA